MFQGLFLVIDVSSFKDNGRPFLDRPAGKAINHRAFIDFKVQDNGQLFLDRLDLRVLISRSRTTANSSLTGQLSRFLGHTILLYSAGFKYNGHLFLDRLCFNVVNHLIILEQRLPSSSMKADFLDRSGSKAIGSSGISWQFTFIGHLFFMTGQVSRSSDNLIFLDYSDS